MTWWHYLLLVNFYLILFFGFYALLLRRETFFQLNRVYLVAASLLSFIIPVIQADWVKNLFITQEVHHTIYSIPVGVPMIFAPVVETGITLGEVLNVVYISVTLFLLLRLGWQLIVLKKAIEKPTPSAAYTFFKKISMGEKAAKLKVIHDHEQVHASQWHSVDVMIIETVMIINWFNPVVYLYRFAIKYIHEFIADSHVINAGTNKAEYAMLLLTQSFDVSDSNLVNQFYNHSLLRKRIGMLQKDRSKRIALLKYGLSAPLFMLMMIFSSATVNNSKAVAAITQKTENALAIPATDIFQSIEDNAQIPEDNLDEENQAIVELPFGIYDVQPVYPDLPADLAPIDSSYVHSMVTSQPSFPGGLTAFGKFLGTHIVFPQADREAGISGKVIVNFVVEKDGSLSGFKAIRGPSQAMKDEAIRVLAQTPKWEPGIQDGKPVRVSYTVPIAFTLEAAEDDIQPAFPGGMESFGKYIGNNIKYPSDDRKAGIQGRVIVAYQINPDGTLTDINVVRSPSKSMSDEVTRVLSKSPKWKPGTKDGKPAKMGYVIPISFSLETEDGQAIPAPPGQTGTSESKVATPSGLLQLNEIVIRGYTRRVSNTADGDSILFSQVEKQPIFPGGLEAFGKFLSQHLKYPKADRDNGIEGKVIVEFIVEKDGRLNKIRAVRGPSQAMMDEAILVLSKSPLWQPGIQNGIAVRVSYTIPIAFVLGEDKRSTGSAIPPNDKRMSVEVTGSETNPVVSVRGLKNDPPPLYVVDGVALDAKTKLESVVKNEDILSMYVFKDEALSIYGDRAKTATIFVVTKNAPKEILDAHKQNQKDAMITALANYAKANPTAVASITTKNGKPDSSPKVSTSPLYVIDGKIVKPEVKNGRSISPLTKIEQKDIVQMEILKDENAMKRYGIAGKDGVIEITTKNAKKKSK